MNSELALRRDAVAAFCRERGIKRFAIFGSALRDDFGPENDIDVLVELFRALLHKLVVGEIQVGELGLAAVDKQSVGAGL